jgi:hypothetical protein
MDSENCSKKARFTHALRPLTNDGSGEARFRRPRRHLEWDTRFRMWENGGGDFDARSELS